MTRPSLGPYTLLRRIGTGGMGEVWIARREAIGGAAKLVAIKTVLPEKAGNAESRRMFLDEARLAMLMNNSNIVQVFDVDETPDGICYMAMEYIEGLDLGKLTEALRYREEQLSLSLIAYIIGEVLKALAYAHDHSVEGTRRTVVHRDISPQNVMLSVSGEVKVTDFGIARLASEETSGSFVRGKFRYMPPEQFERGIRAPTLDLFAVGAILHELLDGKRFRGSEVEETAMIGMCVGGLVPPLSCPPGHVPPVFERLRLGLLEATASKRIQSAREAIRLLSEWPSNRNDKFELEDLVRSVVGDTSLPAHLLAVTGSGGSAGSDQASSGGATPATPKPALTPAPAPPPPVAGAVSRAATPVDASRYAGVARSRVEAPSSTPSTETPATPAESQPAVFSPVSQSEATPLPASAPAAPPARTSSAHWLPAPPSDEPSSSSSSFSSLSNTALRSSAAAPPPADDVVAEQPAEESPHDTSEAVDSDGIHHAGLAASDNDTLGSYRDVSITHKLPARDPEPEPALVSISAASTSAASTSAKSSRTKDRRNRSAFAAAGLVVLGLAFGIGSLGAALGWWSGEGAGAPLATNTVVATEPTLTVPAASAPSADHTGDEPERSDAPQASDSGPTELPTGPEPPPDNPQTTAAPPADEIAEELPPQPELEPEPTTPKPDRPKLPPEQALTEARKASLSGHYARAYSLAKDAYDQKKTGDALNIMGVAACKMGNTSKAKAAHKKMSAEAKAMLEKVCRSLHVEL